MFNFIISIYYYIITEEELYLGNLFEEAIYLKALHYYLSKHHYYYEHR